MHAITKQPVELLARNEPSMNQTKAMDSRFEKSKVALLTGKLHTMSHNRGEEEMRKEDLRRDHNDNQNSKYQVCKWTISLIKLMMSKGTFNKHVSNE